MEKLETKFAPAERVSEKILNKQVDLFAEMKDFNALFASIPTILLVLNLQRQIVFCNRTFMEMLCLEDPKKIYGLRPGEALNCVHAFEEHGGCGTTEFCKTCGAVNAILESQLGHQDIKECRLTIKTDSGTESMDLLISSSPFFVNSEMFTIFYVSDISNEKRRKALERIFFHDVLNTAGGIQGIVTILLSRGIIDESLNELMSYLDLASQNLIEEIKMQRELLAAENNELLVNFCPILSNDIAEVVLKIYTKHEVAIDKKIAIDDKFENTIFESDPTLLKRVVGNMVKNALEAGKPNDTITIGCNKFDNEIEFWVHNSSFMPREIQLQIFQRSFSTKGGNRGIGTYSMKLLSEKYLKGKVGFKTDESTGTTFFVRIPKGLDM